MPLKLIVKVSDIYQYPVAREENQGTVTLGDLHGNALKLIHFLISHGIVDFNAEIEDKPAAYKKLTELYDHAGRLASEYASNQFKLCEIETRMERLTEQCKNSKNLLNQLVVLQRTQARNQQAEMMNQKEELGEQFKAIFFQFNTFIACLDVIDPRPKVRVGGDEVCADGSNDFLTLLVFKLIIEKNVALTILVSNHGVEFLRALFRPDIEGVLAPEDYRSYTGLEALREYGLVTDVQIKRLIYSSYLPFLSAVDCDVIGDDEIVLFSHAPVNHRVVLELAKTMGVQYEHCTKESFLATIKAINTVFNRYVTDGSFYSKFLAGIYQLRDPRQMTATEVSAYPFVYLIWNQWDAKKDADEMARPACINGYQITYVHCDDPYPSQMMHVKGLYTPGGRGRLGDAVPPPPSHYIALLTSERPFPVEVVDDEPSPVAAIRSPWDMQLLTAQVAARRPKAKPTLGSSLRAVKKETSVDALPFVCELVGEFILPDDRDSLVYPEGFFGKKKPGLDTIPESPALSPPPSP